jgi:hypothetical protein
MPVFYKRVDAEQLALSKAQKQSILAGQPTDFSGVPVKHDSGRFFCVLSHKENFIKIEETQWLIKHDNGIWEIVWPDTFKEKYVSMNAVNQNQEKVYE